MTECERLLEAGLINKDFLNEEIRAEYFISREQKKNWAINLDLLMVFKNVCEKHHLRWFLMFGSLLGAIRHRGFIPWDDDVDVAMPRDDDEKLQTFLNEFEFPYFLQTPYTDEGYFYSYIKLRNSNTTCLSRAFRNQGFNQGMMLDIFCLDRWLPEEGLGVFNEIGKLIMDNSNFMRKNMPNPSEEDLKRIKQYSGNDPMDNYVRMTELSQEYKFSNSNYVSLPLIQAYGYQKNIFFMEDFSESTLMSFEKNYEFPVPCGYERILTTIYGDWKKYPPIENRGTWHDSILDADCSYKTKLKECYE